MIRTFSLLICLLCASGSLFSQTVQENIFLRINSETGIYQKGDTVRVWADVKEVPDIDLFLKVTKWCEYDGKTVPVKLLKGENLVFEGCFDEAVQYIFEITDNQNPDSVSRSGSSGNSFAGILVAPEEFKPGYSQPSDFFEFWKKEIRTMRKEKMVPEVTKDTTKAGVRSYHLDINCVGPAPVRAYVAYPEKAARRSLPIIINLHAAGSPGAPSKESVAREYAGIVEGGALAIDINAHGMLDDQPDSYYNELSEGLLNKYNTRPVDEGLENYYFKWMMLRAIRAVDYMTKSPLWDRKHIIVTGTSQGGYQSAFLAGVDPRVTAAVLTVPAGLDQGAHLQGRPRSWPRRSCKQFEMAEKYLPYIDPAAYLHNTKADIWCEIGLYDYTCPAANLFAVLNTVNTEKEIVTYQRGHTLIVTPEDHKKVSQARKAYFQKAATKEVRSIRSR